MKKKIKDLTDKEIKDICNKYSRFNCSSCPLVGCPINAHWIYRRALNFEEMEVEIDESNND